MQKSVVQLLSPPDRQIGPLRYHQPTEKRSARWLQKYSPKRKDYGEFQQKMETRSRHLQDKAILPDFGSVRTRIARWRLC